MRRFVIVGAGLAGAKAAEVLRAEGFDGELVMFGAEDERPYERPELSKGYLQGAKDRDALYVHPARWYAEHEVDLRTGTEVRVLDRAAREVVTAWGERIGYDRLLLATGASPKVPPIPGADGARYLRRVGDSDDLRAVFQSGTRVVIVGAGWIGLEASAAARLAGAEVTVIEPQPTPLHAALGAEVGAIFAQVHRDNGVVLRLGMQATEIRPDGVVTSGGDVVPADVVLVGVGAGPRVGLAEAAGLDVDNGVLVDPLLATSDPAIFAAGDVANQLHPALGERVRVEHWANALNQGKAVAASMLDAGRPYDRVPYFYTDQFSLGMEYSGHVGAAGYDRVVYRGDPNSGEFIAFWLRDGLVLAGMNVNVWDVTEHLQALVRAGWAGRGVDVDRLTNLAVPLATVAEAT